MRRFCLECMLVYVSIGDCTILKKLYANPKSIEKYILVSHTINFNLYYSHVYACVFCMIRLFWEWALYEGYPILLYRLAVYLVWLLLYIQSGVKPCFERDQTNLILLIYYFKVKLNKV